ncbi:ribonuclease E inhibitor RraB [Labedella endophytica]|uniref:Regulator of ribonuclease activity B domain-containing protein n=1 Tax=Labedella endophytica TaxID=1523160 RepID=A0A433JMP0_9MICO|nr:ribonuclease E inhibitor RraB [Labedella endophytica]RUQ96793.1 hypothetical protein ELQ94_17115 [Labedella endophytica]
MGLFNRRKKPVAPAAPLTGNADDDQLLAILATTPGGPDAPRDWVHYLYCATAEGAAAMEARAAEAGWSVRRVHEGEGIVASRQDLAVTAQAVIECRAFFEALAASVDGGEYDGWEASAG